MKIDKRLVACILVLSSVLHSHFCLALEDDIRLGKYKYICFQRSTIKIKLHFISCITQKRIIIIQAVPSYI